MTTAFQSNAFQNNAFQIDAAPTPTPTPQGGGGGGTAGAYGGMWRKGKRPKYWWEKDDPAPPENWVPPDSLPALEAETEALQSYVTDLVLERATEGSLRILRAYQEILQERFLELAMDERTARDAQIRDAVAPIVKARDDEKRRKAMRKRKMALLLG